MSLKLYYHPLSSYCHKALIALYENEIPFEPHYLDLQNETVRADFRKLWPVGKMPVLRDEARNRTVPEATIVIEYLSVHYPGKVELLPKDPDLAWETRLQDRFFDLYLHDPMQRIVGDKIRPEGHKDPFGVEQWRAQIEGAYRILDDRMATRTWAMGDIFTLADCAAAPALFYANMQVPMGDAHEPTAAYLKRLMERPSYARALKEAEPYFKMVPR